MPATATDTVKTAAESAKVTADTMQASAKKTTEQGARAFQDGMTQAATMSGSAFKETTDKTLGALNEINAQSKRNLEAFMASMTAATKGAEVLGSQAMAYAKSSMEGQVEAARTLSTAKSLQEVIELQTAYAKSAMEGYVSELTRASELVSTTMKDAMRPLNERATAVMETVQAAR